MFILSLPSQESQIEGHVIYKKYVYRAMKTDKWQNIQASLT
jgi:hypothetical protein